MGDNFLEDQAGKTRKRREKSAVKRESPKLFGRPDAVAEEFTIDCLVNEPVKVGDLLHCFPGQDGSPVDVIVENRSLGSVGDGGGVSVLRQRIDGTGVGKLRVTAVCELAGTIQAELIQD